jgi:hypothetical protein
MRRHPREGGRICESSGFGYLVKKSTQTEQRPGIVPSVDPWRAHLIGRRMQRNQSGTMGKVFFYYCAGLVCLTSACVRASFSTAEGQDASAIPDTADLGSGAADESVEARICSAPTALSCSSQIASGTTCDPVCQTGSCDWCNEKCTAIAGDGKAACGGIGVKLARSSCTIQLGGTPSQHDDCAPGNICLSPDTGSGYSYCFPLCRTGVDCLGGVACEPRQVSPLAIANPVFVSVCDPEYKSCNPLSASPCCNPILLTGCPSGQYCYLTSPDPSQDSRTVCEYTTGIGGRGATCASSRECAQGWGCSSSGFCQKVCDPTVPGSCPAGGTCAPSGKQFGYCPP